MVSILIGVSTLRFEVILQPLFLKLKRQLFKSLIFIIFNISLMFDVCHLLLVLGISLFLTLPPHLYSSLNHVLASGRGNHSGLFVSLRVLIIAH